jgi:predicted DsbA family dithiol-disulfide isomerase
MGGLIPAWNNFNDEVNFVSRPIQMGPVWMHAGQVGGVPIYHRIWMEDPPSSSYPACIAFKAAELQSPLAAEKYLRLLREAVMLHGQNISKKQVLSELAFQLSSEPLLDFDVNRFEEDMINDKALEFFRKDMQEVNNHNLNRFPTLIFRHPPQQAIMITGYRPYEVLLDAFNTIAPGIEKTMSSI